MVLETWDYRLFQVNNTTDFLMSKQGTLAYITQEKGKQDTFRLWVISPVDLMPIMVGKSQRSIKSLQWNKIDKKKWPKDTMVVYNSIKDTLRKEPQVKRFQVAESADYLVFLKEQNDKPQPTTIESPKKCWLHRKRNRLHQARK